MASLFWVRQAMRRFIRSSSPSRVASISGVASEKTIWRGLSRQGRICSSSLLQTAAADAGGTAADAAQAMLVSLWNVAMAAGGAVGGVLLGTLGTVSLPWSVLVLLLPTLAVVAAARTHGFPATARAGGAVSSE